MDQNKNKYMHDIYDGIAIIINITGFVLFNRKICMYILLELIECIILK